MATNEKIGRSVPVKKQQARNWQYSVFSDDDVFLTTMRPPRVPRLMFTQRKTGSKNRQLFLILKRYMHEVK
jgi:hypothetical protein